jgi:two-component system, cell cycle sensor histidine kinase and response regulator CckA
VTVATEAGRGTAFRVFLPVADHPDGRRLDEGPSEVPRGDGESILVIDDEAPLREVVAAILSQHGYLVHTCGTAGEAVALFQKHPDIRIVLTDINMPKVDGLALARMLRELRADLRIIAVTGLGSGAISADSPSMAIFDERLSKPFRAEVLQAAVHRILHLPR